MLAGGLLLLAGAVAFTLSRSDERLAGTNNVSRQKFVAFVPGGGRVCQRREFVPPETGALRLRIGTYYKPGLPLRLTIEARGRRVATGGLRPGWEQGDVSVPVSTVRRGTAESVICLENRGASRIAIAGTQSGREVAARVDGLPARGRFSIAYMRPEEESWWTAASRVGKRFALGKPGFVGSWTLALALFLAAAAVALAALTAARELRS